jgi:predicted membrane chloride channel (bestrophin family)
MTTPIGKFAWGVTHQTVMTVTTVLFPFAFLLNKIGVDITPVISRIVSYSTRKFESNVTNYSS